MITISMILVIGFLSCVLAYEEAIERFGSVSTELELLQTLKTLFSTGQLFMGHK